MAAKRTLGYFVMPHQPKGSKTQRYAVMQRYQYQDGTGAALLLSYSDKGIADQIAILLNSVRRSEA